VASGEAGPANRAFELSFSAGGGACTIAVSHKFIMSIGSAERVNQGCTAGEIGQIWRAGLECGRPMKLLDAGEGEGALPRGAG
jgi:hypothetical protein